MGGCRLGREGDIASLDICTDCCIMAVFVDDGHSDQQKQDE